MGRRAFLMGQHARKMSNVFRKKIKDGTPALGFYINHVHQGMGHYGDVIPGGRTITYIINVHLKMKQEKVWDDGSYLLSGKVVKSNICPNGKEFTLFAIGGLGLDKNMSALYDCINIGLIKEGAWLDLGMEKKLRLNDVLEKAKEKDDEFFEPVHAMLESYTP